MTKLMTNTQPSAVSLLYETAIEVYKTDGPFLPEDLGVAAFKAHPHRFSLKGYPDHLDYHKVYSALCGIGGMIKKGYLNKNPMNGVLTPGIKPIENGYGKGGSAKRYIEEDLLPLAEGIDAELNSPLNKVEAEEVKQMVRSKIFQLYYNGAKETIGFAKACEFWGIPEGGAPLLQRLQWLLNFFTDLRTPEMRTLKPLHDYLLTRFERQIKVIENQIKWRKSNPFNKPSTADLNTPSKEAY